MIRPRKIINLFSGLLVSVLLAIASSCSPENSSSTQSLATEAAQPETATATETQSPTVTASPTATIIAQPPPTSTKTPRPINTATPSLTPKPTLVPLFESGTPDLTNPQSYSLRSWNAEDAELMNNRVRKYIDELNDKPEYSGVYGRAAYQRLSDYLAISEMEALLRFPEDPQASIWQWDLNFNLANAFSLPEDFDSPGLNAYAVSVEKSLNSGEAVPESLDEFLQTKEPRISFETSIYQAPPGYKSA